MSSDLAWLLVRNNSSFLVKRNGVQFSSEPGNLTNLNSYKFSGIANKKTVDVSLNKEKKKPRITLKRHRGDAVRQPKNNTYHAELGRHMVNHKSAAAAAIKGVTANYRPDLTKYAVARYHALRKSLKVDVAAAQKRTQSRRRKANKKPAAPAAAEAQA